MLRAPALIGVDVMSGLLQPRIGAERKGAKFAYGVIFVTHSEWVPFLDTKGLGGPSSKKYSVPNGK